ncbi:BTB domain-containing protein [Mycena kentingensis (nom. inval.)]|nr:BTB domain-containing protein [Mycena kentingensis (nom. inval.)]
MNDSVPSAKRSRPDDEEVVRSNIWMRAGDIVLQAENTQFRVNSDILARQSSVFADMFELGKQTKDEEQIEGCPIVHLSDSAKDWDALLTAFYDPLAQREAVSIDLLCAMLRLGYKYDMETCKQNALLRLQFECPTNLGQMQNRRLRYTKVSTETAELVISCTILSLATECGVQTAIPAAALRVLDAYSLEEIMNVDPSVLSFSLKTTLVIAAERLRAKQRSVFASFSETGLPKQACVSRATPNCAMKMRTLRDTL